MFPINDLQRHTAPLVGEIEAAFARVARSGWFIMGQEVAAFEREFAAWCGVPECIAVGNGTDALEIALRALGIGAGDRVACVANAGAYGSIALVSIGAVPVYVDIDDASLNMDARALESAIGGVKAVIATHLYGRLADVARISALARAHGVPVIEDCAQSHGATSGGRRCGNFGDVATFSFYPTKNLGTVGDGGALVARDAALASRIRQLRQYGWTAKYLSSVAGGRNSRLDEAQAAVLRVKLPHVDAWNARRREIGARYAAKLSNPHVTVPKREGEGDIVHLYVVRTPERASLAAHLKAAGIASDVHYPNPDYRQPAWSAFAPAAPLPVTERACAEVLTLPCFPEMRDDEVDRVAAAVNAWKP